MRILVIEDERKMAQAIKEGLEQHSFAVDVAYDSEEGLSTATTEPYDLIILDRMLPGAIDGLKIVQTLRQESIDTPVLMLTAKDRVIDRAEGLNAGADDYLVKPFSFVELVARVRALLRRPQSVLQTSITYDDLVIDPENFYASRAGQRIELSKKEFALLEYFMRNPGRIMTKDSIMQHVWDYDADILPNTVQVYIGYLRNKVDKPFRGSSLINTKHGFGYYFGKLR